MALSLLIARIHCDGGQNAHPTKLEPAWALRTSNKDRTLVAVYPQWSEEYEDAYAEQAPAIFGRFPILDWVCFVSKCRASAAQSQCRAPVEKPAGDAGDGKNRKQQRCIDADDSRRVRAEFEPKDWFFHRAFLDTDNNPATGFSVGTIQNGAEFLVEGAFLYRYTGTGRNWSWQQLATVPFELSARSVRWQIDRAMIGESASPNVTGFRVHLQTNAVAEAHSGLYLHHYPS